MPTSDAELKISIMEQASELGGKRTAPKSGTIAGQSMDCSWSLSHLGPEEMGLEEKAKFIGTGR